MSGLRGGWHLRQSGVGCPEWAASAGLAELGDLGPIQDMCSPRTAYWSVQVPSVTFLMSLSRNKERDPGQVGYMATLPISSTSSSPMAASQLPAPQTKPRRSCQIQPAIFDSGQGSKSIYHIEKQEELQKRWGEKAGF